MCMTSVCVPVQLSISLLLCLPLYFTSGVDPGGPPLDAGVHPLYGPLPGPPPPTSSQDQQQQPSRQNFHHHQTPPPHSHAPTQGYQSLSSGGSFSVSNGYSIHGGSQMQGSSVPPPQNHRSHSSHSSSVSPSQRGNSNRASLSSTSSSCEADKGHRHPSPPFLLSQSSSNYHNGNRTPVGGTLSSSNYYSHHAPTTTTTITAGKGYQSQSKDSAQVCPWPSSNGLPTTNQQASKGAAPLYHQAASSNQQQHANSPSWPSTYSSSSLEPSSYSYASFHNTSSSSDGVQQRQPMMPHQLLHVGHVTTPSYSTYSSSDSSSGYNHTGGSSSSSFPSGPLRKDEEKSVEPNILRFTYAELSEATDGFVKDMLGLGSFGTVFRAKVRGNGPYAVKKLYSVSVLLGMYTVKNRCYCIHVPGSDFLKLIGCSAQCCIPSYLHVHV